MIPLGPGAEFDRIRAVAAALGGVAIELGDDCAVLAPSDAMTVLSTDTSVEDVHFRRGWLTLEEIGGRAAAGALSDLAAEGADPVGLLAAISAPRETAAGDLVAVMRGVGAAVAAVGGRVLGGELTSGPVWSLTITVVGRAGRPVRRAGAEPGDGLWVTGALGASRAAVAAWRAGREPGADARRAFAGPPVRIAAGTALAAAGARAMIDLSDGLAGDAAHLAAASAVALEIDLDLLPVAAAAQEEAQREGVDPAAFAAEGGEDFELLAAMPPEFGAAEAARVSHGTGCPLTRIGAVGAGAGVRLLQAGRPVTLQGFDHFR